jgi:hypothetical protein
MRKRFPFTGRIFWPVLIVVAVLVVVAWLVAVKGFGYEMQAQDYPGSAISGAIFAYLVHLWLLPEEDHPPERE